jgi:hypothetical protein
MTLMLILKQELAQPIGSTNHRCDRKCIGCGVPAGSRVCVLSSRLPFFHHCISTAQHSVVWLPRSLPIK